MPPTMKYKSESSPKNVLPKKRKYLSTGRSMKNWTKSVKPFTMKIRCSRTNSTISTFPLSKSTRPKSKEIKIWPLKFKSGKIGIRLLKRAKSKNLMIWGRWWKAKENPWLIGKSERWPSDSRTKGLVWKTRSESAGNYWTTEIAILKIWDKKVRNKKSSSCNSKTTKTSSVITRTNWLFSTRNYWDWTNF